MNGNKQKFFRDEIRRSLLYHALVPCFISLVLIIALFLIMGFRNIVNKSNYELKTTLTEINETIENYREKNKKLSDEINLYDFRKKSSYKVDFLTDIYTFLNNEKYRGDYFLLNDRGELIYTTNYNPANFPYLKDDLLLINESDSVNIIYDKVPADNREISFIMITERIYREGKFTGYSIFILENNIFNSLRRGSEVETLIVNNYGRIFFPDYSCYSSERGKLQNHFRDKTGFIYNDGQWYYICRNSLQNDFAEVFVIYNCTSLIGLYLVSFILGLIIIIIMAIAISRSAGSVADKKTEIVYCLIDALDEVEKGNLNVSLEIDSNDEFEKIGYSFNTMLGSIRHLLNRNITLADENMKAKVQIMESQFNPHFLFNTLESIRYMIKFKPDEAEKMIVSLSRMLRYSIHNMDDLGNVGDEIYFIDMYLKIMLYRYGERLKYNINIDEEFLDVELPIMSLQPIVENAIKYGFGDDIDELEINISAESLDNMLKIRIEDNGSGINEEDLLKLREELKGKGNLRNHFGLYNVNKRIKLVYGSKYGVEIESRKGTAVTVSVPIMREEKDEFTVKSFNC